MGATACVSRGRLLPATLWEAEGVAEGVGATWSGCVSAGTRACAGVLSPLSPEVLKVPAHQGSQQESWVHRACAGLGAVPGPGKASVLFCGGKESKAGAGKLDRQPRELRAGLWHETPCLLRHG